MTTPNDAELGTNDDGAPRDSCIFSSVNVVTLTTVHPPTAYGTFTTNVSTIYQTQVYSHLAMTPLIGQHRKHFPSVNVN